MIGRNASLTRAAVTATSRHYFSTRGVADRAVDAIREACDGAMDASPALGMILGSGMGKVAEEIEVAAEVPFCDIPDFPQSTVSGHAGKLGRRD